MNTGPDRFAPLALAALAASLLAGCTAYQGKHTGRAAPGETTEAEKESGQIYIADLQESSSKVSEALMKDLERLSQEELKPEGQAFLCTLVYGDIANKSTDMPTTDFEMVRERIRDTLLNSAEFRRYFRVVESRERFENLRAKELGNTPGSAGPGDRKINEAYTYFLNGNAFGVHRGSTKGYYINFQLMRASDGSIVFSQKYEQTYK